LGTASEKIEVEARERKCHPQLEVNSCEKQLKGKKGNVVPDFVQESHA